MKRTKKILAMLLCAVLLVTGTVAVTVAYLTSEDTVTNTFTVGKVKITLDEALVNENGEPVAGTWVDEDEDGFMDEDEITAGEKVEEPKDALRVVENDYHLLPNTKHTKDPTVTVKAGSEESYVRMILTVHNARAVQDIIDAEEDVEDTVKDYSDLFDGWDFNEWQYKGFSEDKNTNTISFTFWYKTTVDGYEPVNGVETEADCKLPALFTSIIVPDYVTNELLAALRGDLSTTDDDFKMVIEAHAIQAKGFVNTTDSDGNTITAEENAWIAFDEEKNGN